MRFVALEKNRVLALGGNPKDFAMVARGHVQIAGIIENQIPYVLRTRIKEDRSREFAGRFVFVRLNFRLGGRRVAHRNVGHTFNAIHLAIRVSGGVEDAILIHG